LKEDFKQLKKTVPLPESERDRKRCERLIKDNYPLFKYMY
jgi:hypothetical protein